MFQVYKITNLINNKMYIGLTTQQLKKRWSAHKSDTRSCKALGRAIKKYGADNFKIETIYKTDNRHDMILKEIELIKSLNTLVPNGYNISKGGEFHPVSQNTLNILKDKSKKYWDIQENKDKMSERMLNEWNNIETLGKKEERMSGINEYIENKKRKVIAINYKTLDYVVYDSVNELEKSGISSSALYGKSKTSKGFVLYFLEESIDFYINKVGTEFKDYQRGCKSWDKSDKDSRLKGIKDSILARSIKIRAMNTETGEVIEFNSIAEGKRYGFSNYGLRKGKQGKWLFFKI